MDNVTTCIVVCRFQNMLSQNLRNPESMTGGRHSKDSLNSHKYVPQHSDYMKGGFSTIGPVKL